MKEKKHKRALLLKTVVRAQPPTKAFIVAAAVITITITRYLLLWRRFNWTLERWRSLLESATKGRRFALVIKFARIRFARSQNESAIGWVLPRRGKFQRISSQGCRRQITGRKYGLESGLMSGNQVSLYIHGGNLDWGMKIVFREKMF